MCRVFTFVPNGTVVVESAQEAVWVPETPVWGVCLQPEGFTSTIDP